MEEQEIVQIIKSQTKTNDYTDEQILQIFKASDEDIIATVIEVEQLCLNAAAPASKTNFEMIREIVNEKEAAYKKIVDSQKYKNEHS